MSSTPRKERLAKNEAVFRAANERMADWEERHSRIETELYFCECSDPDCREKIALSAADYEGVRADPRHFFVVAGHEIPDIEDVIERHDDWLKVEKPAEMDAVIEPLDPRSDA